MVFDKTTLNKIHGVFFKKVEELEISHRSTWRADFAALVSGLGIKQIVRGDVGWGFVAKYDDNDEVLQGDCDRFQGCVLIFDPSRTQIGNGYLLVPKKLAEKLLVLGLP